MDRGYSRGVQADIELVDLYGHPGHKLEKWAARAFMALDRAAKKDGLILQVNSSFRTMEKQTMLWTAYVLDLAQFQKGKRATKPSLVARPGWSNHQSGYSIDINRAVGDNLATKEPDSPTDIWLNKNAHRFGFFRDVASEAWHWTFLPEII